MKVIWQCPECDMPVHLKAAEELVKHGSDQAELVVEYWIVDQGVRVHLASHER